MPKTRLISPGSIPNHKLLKNLQLQDNYISNDGGNEGIKITDDGIVSMHPSGQDVYEFGTTAMKMKYWGDADDYLEISVLTGGDALIKTYADPDNNAANLTLHPDGNLKLFGSGSQGIQIQPTTKTASNTDDASVTITETLDHDSAGGSDVHYGIRYIQTQTDITGWDNVYLMHIDGGTTTKRFMIHADGRVQLGIGSPLVWTAAAQITSLAHTLTMTGSTLTLDATGDVVLDADGDQVSMKFGTATGQIDFSNENSGDGVIRQMIDTKDLVIQQFDGSEVIRIADDRKLYFFDKGGEHISSDGDDLTIVAGTDLALDGGSFIKLYDDTVHYGSLSKGTGDTLTISSPAGNIALAPVTDHYIKLSGGTGFTQITASFDATDTDIDFRDGNKQILTLTADITDVHFQFPDVSGNFLCIFLQDGTGGWDVSYWKTKDEAGNAGAGNSGVVKWPGGNATTLTETADKADIISIYWDATNEMAYAVASENF